MKKTFKKWVQGKVSRLISVNKDGYSTIQELREQRAMLQLNFSTGAQRTQATCILHWQQSQPQEQGALPFFIHTEFGWPPNPIAFFKSKTSEESQLKGLPNN